jgi:excinuclease UvrABC ATPase subunit
VLLWVGRDGCDKGGEIDVAGTPEELAEQPTRHRGRYLKQVLGAASAPGRNGLRMVQKG